VTAAGHDGHDHGAAVTGESERRIRLVFLMTAGYAAVQAVGGWLSGSLALIADAGHMISDAAALLRIAEKHAIAGLVIGLPLNMDGSEGPRVQSTRAFVRNLAPLTSLPIVFWDERMSTLAVTRTLLDADASRARRAEVGDKMAAAYILQGALDRLMRMEHDRAEANAGPP